MGLIRPPTLTLELGTGLEKRDTVSKGDSGTDPPVLDHSACWAIFSSLSTSFLAYCMLVFQHVRAGMSAGSRCVSELKPHRVILYEKARYVKTVNGHRSQKTVGAGEHRYSLRWIWGR